MFLGSKGQKYYFFKFKKWCGKLSFLVLCDVTVAWRLEIAIIIFKKNIFLRFLGQKMGEMRNGP